MSKNESLNVKTSQKSQNESNHFKMSKYEPKLVKTSQNKSMSQIESKLFKKTQNETIFHSRLPSS